MEAKKSVKICCIATAIFLIFIIITFVILYFSLFKPKQPKVIATPVGLSHIDFSLTPSITLNLSILIDISLKNPNYAEFEYTNSSASIYYGGSFVGDAAIKAGKVDARSTKDMVTVVKDLADKVIASPQFFPDVFQGSLNMTTMTSLEGKVIVLGIFKLHAKTSLTCDISIFVWKGSSASTCLTKTPCSSSTKTHSKPATHQSSSMNSTTVTQYSPSTNQEPSTSSAEVRRIASRTSRWSLSSWLNGTLMAGANRVHCRRRRLQPCSHRRRLGRPWKSCRLQLLGRKPILRRWCFQGSLVWFVNVPCLLKQQKLNLLFGGRYYPAASMYTLPNQLSCEVRFNFGPNFVFFPEDFSGRPIPRPMSEVPYRGYDCRVERAVENGTTEKTN